MADIRKIYFIAAYLRVLRILYLYVVAAYVEAVRAKDVFASEWVYLTLGRHTSDSPFYIEGTPYLIQAGLNQVSISAKANVGTIYTDKPFEAYGLPGPVDDMQIIFGNSDEANHRYVEGNPNTFSGSIIVNVVDSYGNPISNSDVTFTVQQPQYQGTPPGPANIRNAKIFKEIEDCPGVPTLDGCQNLLTTFTKKTVGGRATAYAVLGNAETTMYTIIATTQKSGPPEIPLTISNAFHHYTYWLSRYRTLDHMVEPTLTIATVHAVDKNGYTIDAGTPGQILNQPLTAVLNYIEEDYEVAGTPPGYYLKGKGTYRTIPVTNVGESTSMVTNGKVSFTIIEGGGAVVPLIQNIQDPNEHIEGKYDAQLTLGQQAVKNVIKATGTAKAYIPTVNSLTGAVYREEREFWSFYNKPTTNFTIWGVTATIEPNQLIMINDAGYPTTDTPIRYKIEPSEYVPQSRYLDIYEKDTNGNETWMGLIPPDTNGAIMLSQGGAKFDPNKAYSAELVLNTGSRSEIKSDHVPLPIGQMQILSDDGTDTPMQGAVTDGAATLKLQLTVKNGSQTLSGLKWGIVDPLVSAATSTIKGTLLDDNGNEKDNPPVVFENGVASIKYRAPETFVRFGAGQTIEAQDRDLAERQVQITLNGQAINSPAIRLKRPPVVLVHGLWGSPKGTWSNFKPIVDGNGGEYFVNFANYGTSPYSNVGSLEQNYPAIPFAIEKALGNAFGEKFAATKVDVIAHSLGGLVTREYCRREPVTCADTIRKFITIDTPHLGSELATQWIEWVRPFELHLLTLKALGFPDGVAFDDLRPNSAILIELQSQVLPIPTFKIAGRTPDNDYGYGAISSLWKTLRQLFNLVPDESFETQLYLEGWNPITAGYERTLHFYTPVFRSLNDAEFLGRNDRIVAVRSQIKGNNENSRIIDNSDHFTVTKSQSPTQSCVKQLLDAKITAAGTLLACEL